MASMLKWDWFERDSVGARVVLEWVDSGANVELDRLSAALSWYDVDGIDTGESTSSPDVMNGG